MAKSEEELKRLEKVKEESESWLKTQHSKNEDHGIQSHHFIANRCGNNGNSDRLYFLGLHNHYGWWHEFEQTLGDGDAAWHAAVWNHSVISCLVLTAVSWPAYRFRRRQVRLSGIPISLRIFQFVRIHTCRGSDAPQPSLDQTRLCIYGTRPDCVSMGPDQTRLCTYWELKSQGRGGWLLSQEVKPKVRPQRL